MSPRPPSSRLPLSSVLEQPLFVVHTADAGLERGSWSSRPATSMPASPETRRPPSQFASSAISLTTSPMMMRSGSSFGSPPGFSSHAGDRLSTYRPSTSFSAATSFSEAFVNRKPSAFKPPFGQTLNSTERDAQNYSLKSRFLAQEVRRVDPASAHLLMLHLLSSLRSPASTLTTLQPRSLTARPREAIPERRGIPQPHLSQPHRHVSKHRRELSTGLGATRLPRPICRRDAGSLRARRLPSAPPPRQGPHAGHQRPVAAWGEQARVATSSRDRA